MKKYCQLVGLSNIQIIFIKVDLPLQDCHIIETNSHLLISRLIHFNTTNSSEPSWYDLIISLIFIKFSIILNIY